MHLYLLYCKSTKDYTIGTNYISITSMARQLVRSDSTKVAKLSSWYTMVIGKGSLRNNNYVLDFGAPGTGMHVHTSPTTV